MRQLLGGLSIKIQNSSVLFSVVLLLTGVIIGGDKLENAFRCINNMNQLILHKEELSEIVDNSYGMRIKAIYSLFNADDVKTLVETLNQKRDQNTRLLNSLDTVQGIQNEVAAIIAQSDESLARLFSHHYASSIKRQTRQYSSRRHDSAADRNRPIPSRGQ